MASKKWSAAQRRKFSATLKKKSKVESTIHRMPLEAIPDPEPRKKYTRKPTAPAVGHMSALDYLVQLMASAAVQMERIQHEGK